MHRTMLGGRGGQPPGPYADRMHRSRSDQDDDKIVQCDVCKREMLSSRAEDHKRRTGHKVFNVRG